MMEASFLVNVCSSALSGRNLTSGRVGATVTCLLISSGLETGGEASSLCMPAWDSPIRMSGRVVSPVSTSLPLSGPRVGPVSTENR